MNYKNSNGLNYILISDTALFQGCSPVETEKLLSGMQFFTKAYKKGVPVYHAGTPVSDIGIVLHGVGFGMVLSGLLCWGWSRARSGRGVNRALALCFWHLPFDVFKRVPASARRHFLG